MSWRKFLLVPRLAAVGLRPSPPPEVAWESYWRDVAETGPSGEVLWDGAGDAELAWWRTSARRHLDPSLAVVDVGCGNGRLARLLAEDFGTVVGVDVSPAAVERARRESQGRPGPVFRVLDVTSDGAAAALTDEFGPVNVVIRGVLHVLGREDRRRAASALASLVGVRGTLLLLETNWRGGLLGYLEYLGARPGTLPKALARLIDHRVPRPSSFGPRELAETFPGHAWIAVESGPVDIAPVRSLGPASGRTIPGFHAVLRRRESSSDVPGAEDSGGARASG